LLSIDDYRAKTQSNANLKIFSPYYPPLYPQIFVTIIIGFYIIKNKKFSKILRRFARKKIICYNNYRKWERSVLMGEKKPLTGKLAVWGGTLGLTPIKIFGSEVGGPKLLK